MNNYEQYAEFKEKQLELVDMLTKSAGVISELHMTQFRDNLNRIGDKVHNESFRILVVGTFKNGKSTFINSFLGENVLPAYSLPCTAVINEVKWGEEKRAVIHFKNPLPEKLPAGIPERGVAHMHKFAMHDIPPLEIPYEEIQDYAVIPFDKDPKEMLLESPYEKIELFWPLELLKNGVEIIDSPGLNEHATRTKVTMGYLAKTDAILFVLNAQQLCSQEEIRFIENDLAAQGFTDPFFIVNRFDLIPQGEREMMRRFAHAKLDEFTSNDIYFVSSLKALEGKMNSDSKAFEDSGMAELEARLSDFLTKEKGKAKLSQPARELKRILDEEALYKVIPMQREALSSSLDDVKARYERAKPKLEQLKLEKEQLKSRLMLRVEQAKPEFRRAALRNITNTVNSLTAWVNDYEPQSKIGLIPSKAQITAVVEEINDYAAEKLETAQVEWRANILEPLVKERSAEIFESVEADLGKIFNEIDRINVDISGNTYKVKEVPTWKRVVGAVGGGFLGGIPLIASGASTGLSADLAKTAALEVGSMVLFAALGMLNPVTLIGIIIGTTIFAGAKNKSEVIKRIKASLLPEMTGKLADSADEQATALAESIGRNLTEVADQVVKSVDVEILSTQEQIEGIIREMEKGRENIEAREAVLKACEEKIKDLNNGLTNFIFQLIN